MHSSTVCSSDDTAEGPVTDSVQPETRYAGMSSPSILSTSLRDGHYGQVDLPATEAIALRDTGGDSQFAESMDMDDPLYAGFDWYQDSVLGGLYGHWEASRCYIKVPFDIGNIPIKILNASFTLRTDRHPQDTPDDHGDDRNITLDIPITAYRVTEFWDDTVIGSCSLLGSLPDYDSFNTTTQPYTISEPEVDITWNVSPIVQYWIDHGNNQGIVIKGPEDKTKDDFPDRDQYMEKYDPYIQQGYMGRAFGTNYFYGIGEDSGPMLNVNFMVNNPPNATITSAQNPPARKTTHLTFQGSGSDPDGDDVSIYEWRSDMDGLLSCASGAEQISVNNLSVGLHRIRLRVRDDFEPFPQWSEPVWQTVRILPNIPEVVEVSARKEGGFTDLYEFSRGESVVITATVEGGTEPLSGWVNISHWESGIQVVDKGNLGSGLSYIWDTSSVGAEKYRVDLVVIDSEGKCDSDGLFGPEADLVLVIVDDTPPQIGSITTLIDGTESVSFIKDDEVTISVIEANGEKGLSGSVNITDPDGLLVVRAQPLRSQDSYATYSCTWDTGRLEVSGAFTIEVNL